MTRSRPRNQKLDKRISAEQAKEHEPIIQNTMQQFFAVGQSLPLSPFCRSKGLQSCYQIVRCQISGIPNLKSIQEAQSSTVELTHEDCLAILGLNWGATEREIRGAYYAKARELHPDRSLLPLDESTARFQVLNEAQDRLRGIDRDEPQDEEA